MATTIGSLDLNAFSDLYNDSTQYFWFEGNAGATYGAGVHITLSPDTSFISNPTGQNILMNTNGISIRNGLLPMMVLDNDSLDFNMVDATNSTYINVASFGVTSTIGVTDGTQSYLYQDYHSLQMFDKENAAVIVGGGVGVPYFYVSDLRDSNGIATISESFIGDGTTKYFNVTLDISSVVSITIDGSPTTAYHLAPITRTEVQFDTAPSNGAIIVITYNTVSQGAKAFTMGIRGAGSVSPYSIALGSGTVASGGYSIACGKNTTASGQNSYAEGSGTSATGKMSHAEGSDTLAAGIYSHAEGYSSDANGNGSHAEGINTSANGLVSHAEGANSHAHGAYAHAQGYDTYAMGNSSTACGNTTRAYGRSTFVIGEYNSYPTPTPAADVRGDHAFIIGNGTSSTPGSNALTVDWDGNVVASGDITCSNIGDHKNIHGSSSTSNVNNSAGTYVTVGVLEHVPNGLWMVNCRARFVPNTGTTGSNYPAIYITTNSSGEGWHQRAYTAGTTNAQLNATAFFELSNANNDNSIYLRGTNNQAGYWAKQNVAQFIIDAIRIK